MAWLLGAAGSRPVGWVQSEVLAAASLRRVTKCVLQEGVVLMSLGPRGSFQKGSPTGGACRGSPRIFRCPVGREAAGSGV